MGGFRIAALAFAMTASPAVALDPIVVPMSGDAALPIHEAQSFDWDGFYAGVYGTGTASPAYDLRYGVGLNVGFNHAFDYVLVGGEVAFSALANADMGARYLQAVGRGGVLVTDNVFVFGAAGVGTDVTLNGDNHLLAGAGLELGVTDNVSLRGQYLHGFGVTKAAPVEQVTIGAEFHF